VARSHRRGAELVALELAAELDARGHVDHVVALAAPAAGAAEPVLPPLVDTVGSGPADLVRQARRVRPLVADPDLDVVVAHGGWAAQVLALSAPRRRPRLVWQRIGDLSEGVWRPSRRWWWQWVARRYDAAVALTRELEDELRRLRFRGPVWRIPNFRDPERFRDLDRGAASDRLRTELGVDAGVHLVAFVGYLDARKRADRAVEVHARLVAGGGQAHLVVVGDGPRRDALEADVARRGVGDSVSFLGRRADVEQVLAGADVLVITSDVEGIPGVAIEALMAGCPVVTVPVGGVAEVVEDGVTGVVLADADPGRAADTVRALLDDEPRRRAMGAAGRARTDRFSAAAAARAYERSFLALVGPR
jgi:glycosyltransferase involved in cell wall biosynthesis